MTEPRTEMAGAIIAGGLSSRMNEGGLPGDKFLQPLGSDTVIAHIAKRLEPQVSRLFINANGDPRRLAHLGLPVVADLPAAYSGPLAGILTALLHARNFSWLITAAADSPFLPPDLGEQLFLRQKQTGTGIVLASSAGHIHPVFGLWRTDLAPRLEDWLRTTEKASVLAFARHIGFETVDFPLVTSPDGGETCDPFLNINRPGDLDEARRLYGAVR